MIYFPNIKLNIGLYVTSKREDGYHNIETIFHPISKPFDILEIIDNKESNNDILSLSGINIDGKSEDNLIIKAINKVRKLRVVPPLQIHLHKNIPAGSGLGGGSSDAAHTLKLVNEQYSLNLSNNELKDIAKTIGADCAVFIDNKPVLAKGIGTEFSEISFSLSGYWVQIVIPPIHVSTKDAYASITPKAPTIPLAELILLPIEQWKDKITNDFEKPLFKMHKELSDIKNHFYNKGAIYSSMSGSGSSIYGIFTEKPKIQWNENYFAFTELID